MRRPSCAFRAVASSAGDAGIRRPGTPRLGRGDSGRGSTLPAREIAGHVLLVRLERAAADLEQLRVTQQALDRELGAIAVAAEHLHGIVGDLLAEARLSVGS